MASIDPIKVPIVFSIPHKSLCDQAKAILAEYVADHSAKTTEERAELDFAYLQRLVELFDGPAQRAADEMRPTALAWVASFRTIAGEAHRNSKAKGFWDLIESLKLHPRFAEIEVLWKLSRIALFHSEASEALEGIRKNLNDDHLPHRSMEVAELADVIIRILDYAGAYDLPIAEVVLEKMSYNTTRPFMHGDKRA